MIQEEENKRSFAVGVQLFDWIRLRKAPYIDKTKYVWQMVSTNAQYSQDRRTIDSYRVVNVK